MYFYKFSVKLDFRNRLTVEKRKTVSQSQLKIPIQTS